MGDALGAPLRGQIYRQEDELIPGEVVRPSLARHTAVTRGRGASRKLCQVNKQRSQCLFAVICGRPTETSESAVWG